jgi:hypothetical protein
MKVLPKTLGYKVRSKIRSSNIWKLWKLIISKKKAQAAHQECEHTKNSTLVIDGQCILIPAFRADGVGIQAMVRICVMLLARQANATYVHLPFLKLAHQNIDPTGRSLTPEEWAAKWEMFFNFGKDEFHIADLASAMGQATLDKHMSAKDRQFGDPQGVLRDMLPNLVEKIRSRDSGVSGIYTFGLGLCRQPRECQLFLDAEFINILQEKFGANGYRPEEMLYSEQYLNIAIHIRRGDVWDACQAGSKRTMYTNKLVCEVYYVGLLQRLQNFFGSSPKPVRFHVFSDGRPDDFVKFTFTGDGEAFLKLESGTLIENIQFHLRQSTINTLYHMIKAPIFVPGKSTFSVVAVLLSNSYVFYEDDIREFYQYDLLEKYIEGNPMFISLTQLEDRVVDVMEALSDSEFMD